MRKGADGPFSLASPDFLHQGPLPRRYTVEGDDASPPLEWSGAPPGTKSFALIMDDPDAPDPRAPQRTWVHWVLFDLPAAAHALPADAARHGLPAGARQGANDWHRADYGGPAPPIGRHRYFFRLYALDTLLSQLECPTKAQLVKAMGGHVLAQAELMGTYAMSR